MSSFDRQLGILKQFVNEGFITTDWFQPIETLKTLKKLEACGYAIRYSITKPKGEEWNIKDTEALRIGTSGGKWGGKSVDSNVNSTFRQKRRSNTSQPYDRIQGHLHNLEHGPESNEIKKNWGGAARAFAPVQSRYGYGKKILQKIWTQLTIPKENMDWPTQILRLEISELCAIWQHKNKFNGMAPLTDLKYASIPQKELQSMLSKAITTSSRRTKIINDEDYAKGDTNNTNAFIQNLEKHFV